MTRVAAVSLDRGLRQVSPVLGYAASLVLSAGALGAWLGVSGYSLGPVWVLAALSIVAAVAERGSVRLSSNLEMSISILPTLFVAVAFGPLASMIVSAVSMVGDFRPPYMRWAVYTFSRSINGALTGLVATSASGFSSNQVASIAIATVAASLTAQTVDIAFASFTVKLRGSGSFVGTLQTLLPVLLASVPLYVPVVVLLGYAYHELSHWTVLLFLVPALAAQYSWVRYQQQRSLAEDLASANKRLEKANLSFAAALVAALDARDRYTAGHSAAVAIYARDIAARLGLSDADQQLAHLCGLLHDIGKVGLPPGILEKTGSLSPEERQQMEEHSIIGERILANVEDYGEIAKIVRHHHERVDGKGYPDQVRSNEIPIISRIIAVADAYNAMTSGRPYREALPSRVARQRLVQAVETQFDTTVVTAFEAILVGASETYVSGARADFALEAQQHPALALQLATSAA